MTTQTEDRAQAARREAARLCEAGELSRHEVGPYIRARLGASQPPQRTIGERMAVGILKGANALLGALNTRLREAAR